MTVQTVEVAVILGMACTLASRAIGTNKQAFPAEGTPDLPWRGVPTPPSTDFDAAETICTEAPSNR